MNTTENTARSARLAAITLRADAATEGPWATDGPDIHGWAENPRTAFVNTALVATAETREAVVRAAPPEHPNLNEAAFVAWMPTAEANMAFVAHARDDIPWLLEQLAASEAKLQEFERRARASEDQAELY